ncbi:ArsS family sensor histidine kinase [Sulfurovum sp. zt1-1]|uniref:histidine kinase n=1 Tax=Sulfurovum zhangzhouensis TaxID=3019067 RepID=A0ABT7QZQ1_9BACT|nr:ArsS family sensor histidine kinase [Sulfurovum zhangzhouensis]MDM5272321.1 ArsS family sensor histidine kinase [Sulfurovum zhangzhouensis]
MNQHSVFFKLNILFMIALMATVIAGSSFIIHFAKKDNNDLLFKGRIIMHEYKMTQQSPLQLFEELDLTLIKGKEKEKILRQSSRFLKQTKEHLKRGRVIRYQDHLYLYLENHHINFLLRDDRTYWERFFIPLLVMIGTIVLLISMYILLRKTLVPLKTLQKDIERYGEGTLKKYVFSDKNDEISQVSNAFYKSVSKIQRLSDSRTLFIRNLFHELNTPVTKGKILTEIVEDPKTKTMLDAIFSRLASLLKELAQVEQITSENYVLSKKEVRIIDLIDEAKDLLYLDQTIRTNVTDQTIFADFASMSIVFKNLIDNALKYGQNLMIHYEDDALSFISEGEALKGEFSAYLEPFSDKKSSETAGFGLGLYIVKEVLNMHNMGLEYTYHEGKNQFTVNFKNIF